jgi:hypothetical protein
MLLYQLSCRKRTKFVQDKEWVSNE